jgi:hypothetical protein
MRRVPPPWTVEKIPGGVKVVDFNRQSLAYVYSRETESDAQIASVLTENEAGRIAINIANLPALLARQKSRKMMNWIFQKEEGKLAAASVGALLGAKAYRNFPAPDY